MRFQIRRLELSDMGEVALVHRAAFDDRLPWLAGLHTPDEDQAFFREHVFTSCKVWGATEGRNLVGIIAVREGWVDQLYVLPGHQRRGVGAALLGKAKDGAPSLSLWTFQRNTGARRFYEAHGFRAVRETDGSGNEEREPDVLYRWDHPGSATGRGRPREGTGGPVHAGPRGGLA